MTTLATRAVIVYGLRAEYSIKEIMSHEDIKKSTVKRTLGQKLTIFRTTVRKEVPEDLRYKSYVMKRGGTDVRALTGKEEDA